MQGDSINNLYREFKANQQIFKVLESSKSLTDGIFDELPVCLILVDQDRLVLKFNSQASRIFNKTEAGMLGRPVSELFDAAALLKIERYFADVDGDRFSFEQKIRHNDQELVMFWHLCRVFEGKNSQVVHALLGSDITEARKAHESLIVLTKDIELASAVQSTLLPENAAYETDTYKITGYYEPAAQVGGDLWLLHKFPNATMATIIDVMGHGAGSAMVTSLVSGALEAISKQLNPAEDKQVFAAMQTLHDIIVSTCKDKYMVCVAMLIAENQSDHITIYSAGMPPACLISAGNHSFVRSPGNPIGVRDIDCVVGVSRVPMNKGDRLVLFTDGCYEQVIDNKMLGRGRFAKMLVEQHESPGDQAVQNISQKLRLLRKTQYAPDDVTMVIIDRK